MRKPTDFFLLPLAALLLLFNPSLALGIPAVRVEPSLSYAVTLSRSFDFKLDLACDPIRYWPRLTEITDELKKRLVSAGIQVLPSAPFSLNLAVEEFACGKNGEENSRQYPLGFALTVRDASIAFLRVSIELVDRKTSEVVWLKELTAVSPLSEEHTTILYFSSDQRVKKASFSKLWSEIHQKIAEAVSKL